MTGLPDCLSVRAGPAARAHLEREGFDPAHVRMMVGASGGAKWLVLAGLDRALIRNIVPRFEGPVHLLGSSIGVGAVLLLAVGRGWLSVSLARVS